MKLKHNINHISIKPFKEIELKDFSVLTGKNGSGKTHLLQAINQGKVLIEGIDYSEIIYYNYNDFTVFDGKVKEDSRRMKRLSNWNNNKTQLIQKYNNVISSLRNKIFQNIGNDEVKKYILSNAILTNFDFEKYYGNNSDYDLLEKLKIKGIDSLPEFINKFTPKFYQLLTIYKQNNKDISQLNKEFVRKEIDDFFNELHRNFEEKDKDYYDYIQLSSIEKKGGIKIINTSDIENPDFIIEDIALEEKKYQTKKFQNLFNKLQNEEWGNDIEFLSKDEFIHKNGISPIEQINKVLTKYDCNGYKLTNNNFKIGVGQDQNKVNLKISLTNSKKNILTDFKLLSSGEKTLIALSLLIFKCSRNKILPRVLLLDEIDSSLHPSMIKRLLVVIQEYFVRELKLKIILATHSPSTVALAPLDSIFTIENDRNVTLIKRETPQKVINTLTEGFASLNIEDSNIGISYNISNTTLPILFTEGITDKIILEIAWKKLYQEKLPFFIQECFDASFLANLFRRGYDNQDGIFINYNDRVLIALFDFDEAGYRAWNSIKKLDKEFELNPKSGISYRDSESIFFKVLLPVPNNNIAKQVIKKEFTTYKDSSRLSIELLFYGISSLEKYYQEETIIGGSKIIKFTGDKRKFAKEIEKLKKEDFSNFISLFNLVKRMIK